MIYAGIIGKRQGEKNDNKPAKKAEKLVTSVIIKPPKYYI